MSHAVYSYLLSLDLSEQDGKVLCQSAMGAFDGYAERHLDENNWYSPVLLVLKDNRVLTDFADPSNRYEPPTEQELTAYGWDKALRFAFDCALIEIEAFNVPTFDFGKDSPEEEGVRRELDALSMEAVYQKVLTLMPNKIIGAYQEFLAKVQKGKGPNPFHPDFKQSLRDMEDWRRKRMADHFELFVSAHLPPFSTDIRTPYDYRCYDLTNEEEANAILQLDIHT